MIKGLINKLKESLFSVLPITVIVLLLNFFIPFGTWTNISFIIGAVLLIVGMGLFSLGADTAMINVGTNTGKYITKKNKLWILIVIPFLIGMMITIAEPDLTVLADQVSINRWLLILSVAVGVGIFMVIAILRVVMRKDIRVLLLICYVLLFILAIFVPDSFVPIAFDSGGVTTGPMTVPFIIAVGVGVAAMTSGSKNSDASFGYVALCSIGPILMVLILGFVYTKILGKEITVELSDYATSFSNLKDIFANLWKALKANIVEVGLAVSPILIFSIIFELFIYHDSKRNLFKIIVGFVYSFIGLTIFLTGAKAGFMPIGSYIGSFISTSSKPYLLVVLGGVIGFFVVMAEPAVHVLIEQVENVTGGSISKTQMLITLAIGVGIAIAIAMARVVFDFSIWYVIIPGYALSMILMFFVPKIFTSIAFDSGGVASGPMTASFILPIACGACMAINPDAILTDGFGVVALVAMTPLIVIEILGLVYKLKMPKIRIHNKRYEEIITYDVKLPTEVIYE